jgi:hypothetical protein
MSNVNPLDVKQIQDSLVILGKTIETLSKVDRSPDMTQIPNAGISGDKVHGGRITKFQSTGIRDDSTRLVVVVDDNGILTDYIDVETLVGDTTVEGNLTVNGEIHARKLHVDELSADIRNERSTSLEFHPDDAGIYNKGLIWIGEGPTKQFILRNNPDRLWSSISIDLSKDASLHIGGQPVISETSLGTNIRDSRLRTVGTLEKLTVQGNVNLSQFVFWDADSNRLGLGTETPNAQLSVAGWDQEFIVDVDERATRIGNYTAHEIQIVTDDTARITVEAGGKIHFGSKDGSNARVSVHGKLGVGVNNIADDVTMAVAGPVRIENKKFEVGSAAPTSGTYRKGDMVWNNDPKPTGYVGWICVREGAPGEWKTFGQISS